MSERTLERWRRWWRSTLPATLWWRAARARFVAPPEAQALPGSLLARFGPAASPKTLIAALAFLSPCSLSSFPVLPGQAA